MKMIMVAYNEALESEAMDSLMKCGIEYFTKWTQVYGKGKTSGPHFGSEVWPGENSVIFAAVDDKKAEDILECVREARLRLGKEGIKAFCWKLDEMT